MSASVFEHIYKQNIWQGVESKSGTGSTLEQTIVVRQIIEQVVSDYNIHSLIDVPCGDFNWMSHTTILDKIQYLGIDIVEDIIKNNIQHTDESKQFIVLDIMSDQLPDTDLILIRDCLVHFSFEDILKTMYNLRRCNYKYILMTNFIHRDINMDIITGQWRTLNFFIEPFLLPPAIMNFSENCSENNGIYLDKTLSLWDKDTFETQRHDRSLL